MRRYKYIGRDGSSGYRTGKHYWGRAQPYIDGGLSSQIRVDFIPLNINRIEIAYTTYERFKADWE